MNSFQEQCRRFQAPAIPDGQQISVDQDGWNQVRFFGLKRPESAPELDPSGRILPESVGRKEAGVQLLTVEGSRSWLEVSGQAFASRLSTQKEAIRLDLRALGPIQLLRGISSE
jgi:hypothetical protein